MSDTEFKVVILGDEGVGKTSLLNQLTNQPFQIHARSTMGAPQSRLEITHGQTNHRFLIYDTAGEDVWQHFRQATLQSSHTGPTHVVILVLDMLEYPNINQDSIKKYLTLIKKAAPHAQPVIALNKDDLAMHAKTTKKHIYDILENATVPVIRTSAKAGHNMLKLKHALVDAALVSIEQLKQHPPIAEPVYPKTLLDLWKRRQDKALLIQMKEDVTDPMNQILQTNRSIFQIGLKNALLRFAFKQTSDFKTIFGSQSVELSRHTAMKPIEGMSTYALLEQRNIKVPSAPKPLVAKTSGTAFEVLDLPNRPRRASNDPHSILPIPGQS